MSTENVLNTDEGTPLTIIAAPEPDASTVTAVELPGPGAYKVVFDSEFPKIEPLQGDVPVVSFVTREEFAQEIMLLRATVEALQGLVQNLLATNEELEERIRVFNVKATHKL